MSHLRILTLIESPPFNRHFAFQLLFSGEFTFIRSLLNVPPFLQSDVTSTFQLPKMKIRPGRPKQKKNRDVLRVEMKESFERESPISVVSDAKLSKRVKGIRHSILVHIDRKDRRDFAKSSKRAAGVTNFEPFLRFADDLSGTGAISHIPLVKGKFSLIQKTSKRVHVTLRLNVSYDSPLYQKAIGHFSLINSPQIVRVDRPQLVSPPLHVTLDGNILSFSCHSSFCQISYLSLQSLRHAKRIASPQIYVCLLDALSGLEYLHSHGVWHGSVNTKSIFVDIQSSKVRESVIFNDFFDIPITFRKFVFPLSSLIFLSFSFFSCLRRPF